MGQFAVVDPTAFFGGYVMLHNEGMEDHFMMGTDHASQRGQHIFADFMKTDVHLNNAPSQNYQQAHHHLDAMTLNRSQSVLLPPQTQIFGIPSSGLIDPNPLGVSNSLGGVHGFDQFAQGFDRNERQTGRQAKSNPMMDPFFDASDEELSSIEQSRDHGDAYNTQHGFNPYEQAKRLALQHQNIQAANPKQSRPSAHFESPLEILTPLNAKQNAVRNGLAMEHGTSTPSHFLSAVDIATRGQQQGVQMPPEHVERQQLSVGRIYGVDPLGLSARFTGGDRQQDNSEGVPQMVHSGHELSNLQENFGNTPSGLLCAGESHRQHLSVSRWNLDEAAPGQTNQSGSLTEQIY